MVQTGRRRPSSSTLADHRLGALPPRPPTHGGDRVGRGHGSDDVNDAYGIRRAGTSDDSERSPPEEALVEESLVEEVSIDGMCGVY